MLLDLNRAEVQQCSSETVLQGATDLVLGESFMSAKTRHQLALLLALGTSAILTACANNQPNLEDAKKYNTPPKQEQTAPPVAPSEAPPQQ